MFKFAPEYEIAAMIVGAVTTILIRVLATIFRWNMPKAINFSKERALAEIRVAEQEKEENSENCK